MRCVSPYHSTAKGAPPPHSWLLKGPRSISAPLSSSPINAPSSAPLPPLSLQTLVNKTQDSKERSAELVCHNSRWVVFEAESLRTTLWQYCTWFLTFWSDATPILHKKFKAVWLSHLDDYCTIMIGAGSTKEFQRIGLIMLKYGSSLMEHFSTSTSFFLCAVRLTGCGFHGCFFFF